jgi:sortase A
MVRRHLGWALVVSGGLMVSFAGGRYALGAVKADEARQAWDAAEAKASVAQARAAANRANRANRADPGGPVVIGAPVARLLIPKIALDDIVLEGVDGDQLNAGPGHLPGSALPGDLGNAVVSAHRDRHFSHFDRLSVGDTIVTETTASRTTWIISKRRIIDKDDPALFRTSDATLTLTTCWPVRYLGTAPERLILTAKVVRAGG